MHGAWLAGLMAVACDRIGYDPGSDVRAPDSALDSGLIAHYRIDDIPGTRLPHAAQPPVTFSVASGLLFVMRMGSPSAGGHATRSGPSTGGYSPQS